MKFSVILPTYNNERTLDECLKSIFAQKFSKKDFEVLLIDGYSEDKTLFIAKKYPVKIFMNKERNEEAARILGIKKAKGDVLCFIDADNVLDDLNWLGKMNNAFKDKTISFADTLFYSYRESDKVGVRYQALIGGDDPFVMYMGYYSRYSWLTKDWTGYPYESEDKKDYLKIKLKNKELVPAMGSNGFLVRKKIAKQFVKDKFLHSDFVYDLVNNGHNSFAKVKTGIVHNQPQFFPNKIRRVQRRGKKSVNIKYNYGIKTRDIVLTSLRIALIIPVLYDTISGFARKPDSAWFFHPVACLGELFIYGFYSLLYMVKRK